MSDQEMPTGRCAECGELASDHKRAIDTITVSPFNPPKFTYWLACPRSAFRLAAEKPERASKAKA